MKKVILTLAIAVMGFSAAFAQDSTKRAGKRLQHMQKMTAEQRAEKSTASLEKELSLTADQKTKVYAIELERAKKVESLRTGNPEDFKAHKPELKAAMDKSQTDLNAILTAEQKTKLDAFRAEQKGKMKDRKPGGGRGGKEKAPVVSNPPSQG